MYYVDPHIKETERVFPPQGRYGYHRYDMNENPEGLPEEFVAEVLQEITPSFLSVYPEPDRFLNKYAAFIGASYDNLVAVNGSDMGIRYLFETFGEKGKEVVTVAPSFEMYWVNCNILGLKHVPVSYEEDLTIKVEKILEAISEDTRIVVLLNPNNPIGNVYSDQEVQQIIAKAKQVGAIVIIDEAYHYFYPNTFLKYALSEENVVVMRTFSKLFSIAACRLGVLVGHPQLIGYVKNAKLTFDANAVALLFAERILDHPEMVEKLIAAEHQGREYALKTLQEHGYEVRDCRGNFIFVVPRKDPFCVAEALEQEKILVKTYRNPLLSRYLRISTGSVHAMKLFLEAFLRVDQA